MPKFDSLLKTFPVEEKSAETPTTEDEGKDEEKEINEELSSIVRSFVESAVQETPLRQGEFSLGPQLKGAKGFWQGNCLMVQDASGRVKNLGIMK